MGLDLHGNSKKKEVSPDGSADKNVFDIQQGVAIYIAVRKRREAKKPDSLGEIFHGELWGSRATKYATLWENTSVTIAAKKLQSLEPEFPFISRNNVLEEIYRRGFGVQDLLPVNSVGIVTSRDELSTDMQKDKLWQRVQDFAKIEPEDSRKNTRLGKMYAIGA